MTGWIRKIAAAIGMTAFFGLLFVGMAASGGISWNAFVPALIRAAIGACLVWVAAIIAADIVVKGAAADIPADKATTMENGLLRRIAAAGSGEDSAGQDASEGRTAKRERHT